MWKIRISKTWICILVSGLFMYSQFLCLINGMDRQSLALYSVSGLILIFPLASFIVLSIWHIIIDIRKKMFVGLVELLVLFFLVIFFVGLAGSHIDKFKSRNTITHTGFTCIRTISMRLKYYPSEALNFPDANYWNNIFGFFPDTWTYYSKPEYHFAFNRNLSNLSKDETKGEAVMVFEAEGQANLSGGAELIIGDRPKDKYFKKKDRFIYIAYVDGTIARYRLRDKAVALYDGEKEEFSGFYKSGETPYSPLRWEP